MKKGIPAPKVKNIVDPIVNTETYYNDYMYSTFSMLKVLLDKSPLHFKYYSENPIKESAAMKFGTAFHMYCLEGKEAFDKAYAVEPDGIDKRTTLGKVTWENFMKTVNGRITIPYKDFSIITNMDKALREHNHYSLLDDTLREHIHLWNNESKDILCKCRIDAANFKKGYIVDIKTTRDASPASFEETIIKNKYHMQAAFYLDGTELKDYYIFAIEKLPPYGMCVYKLDKTLIQEGRNQYVKGLELMKEMKEKGEVGYNNNEIKILKWS